MSPRTLEALLDEYYDRRRRATAIQALAWLRPQLEQFFTRGTPLYPMVEAYRLWVTGQMSASEFGAIADRSVVAHDKWLIERVTA